LGEVLGTTLGGSSGGFGQHLGCHFGGVLGEVLSGTLGEILGCAVITLACKVYMCTNILPGGADSDDAKCMHVTCFLWKAGGRDSSGSWYHRIANMEEDTSLNKLSPWSVA
jgi:hypothetical protein